MKGIIYKWTCSKSGKSYIGQTINPKARRMQHKSAAKNGSTYPFHAAIRKYGINSFIYSSFALLN